MKLNNNYFIVRHGYSENLSIRSIMRYLLTNKGNKEDSLTEEGINQMRSNIVFFKKLNIDVIFSSDFKRARQTAEIINSGINCQLIFRKDIGENGKKETMKEAQKRAREFFEEINSQYKNKKILIVSHRGFLAILKGILEGKSKVAIIFDYVKNGLRPGECKELKV